MLKFMEWVFQNWFCFCSTFKTELGMHSWKLMTQGVVGFPTTPLSAWRQMGPHFVCTECAHGVLNAFMSSRGPKQFITNRKTKQKYQNNLSEIGLIWARFNCAANTALHTLHCTDRCVGAGTMRLLGQGQRQGVGQEYRALCTTPHCITLCFMTLHCVCRTVRI